MEAYIAGLLPNSLVNGTGTRTVIFMAGCNHFCEKCHNKDYWPMSSGAKTYLKTICKEIEKNIHIINGITLSGGDPFLQPLASAEIAKFAKSKGLTVWTYTGYTLEELNTICKEDKNDSVISLLENTDVLVDGKFISKLKDDNLKYKGSSNQNIIALKKGEGGCEFTGSKIVF